MRVRSSRQGIGPYTSGIPAAILKAIAYAMIVSDSHADNPIVTTESLCDPHIRIFNDKAYLFSSHDQSPKLKNYQMRDWQLWSSADLVSWKKEAVLKPEDTYIGPMASCWATDGAERNGKHYWYFSNHNKNTGVAVSTNGPAGPYVDALRKPLLDVGLTPTEEYDPTVFIDDDKTPYLIFGHKEGYRIARLNDDMVSLAEEPRQITINDGWVDDANFVHKHNGNYYLNTHGSLKRSKNRYATATNIYGPYTGRSLGPASSYPEGYLDHLTFFSWHNQNYYAFGTLSKLPDGKPNYYYRFTKIGICNYRNNGDIALDLFTAKSPLGVGQYDAAWEKIEAEYYFKASDGVTKAECAGGFEVRDLGNGSHLVFPNIRNVAADATVGMRISAATGGGSVEIREGSPSGSLLGSCRIPPTNGLTDYRTLSHRLKNTAGSISLAFVFKSQGSEKARLDWFTITRSQPTPPTKP